jgi:tetratricopeptide (TPR) repeat protein
MKPANKLRPIGAVSYSLLALLGVLFGCGGPAPQSSSPPQAATPPESAPAGRASSTAKSPPAGSAAADSTAKPITDDEAQAFAKTLETALKSADAGTINALFDYDAVLSRALEGVEIPEGLRQKAIDTGKKILNGPDGIGAEFTRGARYHLLRVHRVADQPRALFRETHRRSNYIDFVLHRSPDGKVTACDLLPYAEGRLTTEDIHQESLRSAAQASPGFVDRLPPADRAYIASKSDVNELHRLVAEGKFKEALDVYQKLPNDLKNHYDVLHDHFVASCALDAECDDVIKAYQAAYPNDPGIDWVLIGYYVRHGRGDDALSCIDRLDKAVGGDPLLDADRALAFLAKGDVAAAKQHAQNAAASEPDDPLAQDCLKAIAEVEKSGPIKRSARNMKPGTVTRGEPADDKEAKVFAESFAKSVSARDAAAVRAALNATAMFQRTMEAAGIPEEARGGIQGQFSTIVDPTIADFFGFNVPVNERGSPLRLLHLRRVNGEQHALFRLVLANDGVTYFDASLVRQPDGKVQVDDVYSFDTAISFSELLRLVVQGTLEKLMGVQAAGASAETSTSRLLDAANEMHQRIEANQGQAALDIYAKLPGKLQEQKIMMIMRIRAASKVRGKPYDDSIRDYRKAFPNEPNLNLLLSDAYLDHEMYDRMIACFDKLDETIGGDPYLDVLRGGACRLKGDLATAKSYFTKAIAAEPDLDIAYSGLLAISLQEKQFAETARLLSILQKKSPEHMPAVQSDPAYAAFLKTAQYREWAKSQKR